MSSPILQPSNLESIDFHLQFKGESIHLLNDDETLLIGSEEEFVRLLNVDPLQKLKVVSIFGNTGDGKSHTLNQTFFGGREVFKTSALQKSCTIGVWMKYDPDLHLICIDTEGFLGVTKKENQRLRLLLKIIAISDIVIYRTRSERLPSDMYSFLGGASRAYKDHFATVLGQITKAYELDRTTGMWGPCVLVFHETSNTETLDKLVSIDTTPEDVLREDFAMFGESCDGFSSLKYVGVRNQLGMCSFIELRKAVEQELINSGIRVPRTPRYVYRTLKALNNKFLNHLSHDLPHLYLSSFFTCPEKCQSCDIGCSLSIGHLDEDEDHFNSKLCKRQHQFDNVELYCKKCLERDGKKIKVEFCYQSKSDKLLMSIISTVWSGYKIECEKCGLIYQSREHWFGNEEPHVNAVIEEAVHVWSGKSLLGAHNSAQKVLDSVASLGNIVASVGSQPTKMISDWMTDQIAPPYWRKNNEIQECFKCNTPFENKGSIHHCRACGEGFCETCSSRKQSVPARGWLEDVRVCDICYREQPPSVYQVADGNELLSRRLGESFMNSMSLVKSYVVDKPKELIKDMARPTYWTPDSECEQCVICRERFGALLALHHCRDCGKGVCDKCSPDRKPVPLRGWDTPVRVCSDCAI